MRLDYTSKGYFTLHSTRQPPRHLTEADGWTYSHGASSSRGEHVLFTSEPYAALQFFDMASPSARVQLSPIQQRIVASRETNCDKTFAVPYDRELWPFQAGSVQYALDTFNRGGGCLVGDEPGLGKTEIAIAVANELRALRVLVICPASIRQQWAARIRLWSTIPRPMVACITSGRRGIPPSKHWHYTIVSYDLARSKPILAALLAERYDLLVLDEAHYSKTSDSGRTRAILGDGGISGRAEYTLALTGTPLPNRPAEIFTLAKALCWDSIDWMSEHAFLTRFNQRVTDLTPDGRLYVRETQGHHQELQARLRGNFMVRHLKRDVMPQLKMPVYDLVQVEETGPVRQALAAERLLDIDPDTLAGADAKILGQVARVRRQMGIAMAPQVADYTRMLFDGGEQKLLLGGWHIETLDIYQESLHNLGVVRVDGRTSETQKAKAIHAFQHDPKTHVIIGNLLSLGVGTDGLQDVCNHAILGEPDWVAGNNQQFFDRLDRGGQTRTVQCDIAVAPSSIAERILATALKKARNVHSALDAN